MKSEPSEVEVAAGQEDEADFLLALYRSQPEGLFLVAVSMRELYYLSDRASILSKELDVYSVVLAV